MVDAQSDKQKKLKLLQNKNHKSRLWIERYFTT